MERVIVKGVGSYLPERILTNEDLEGIIDTSNEWIVTRTGIESRRVCLDTETASDLCVEAARKAMSVANISVYDVDMIIVATITPDLQFPSTACIVQKKLGCTDIPCFDIGAACSGFIYAIDVGRNLIANNASMRNILVIGGEKLSSIVDWEDRGTCILFGDGAGAVVLSKESNGGDSGILDILIGADGSFAKILFCSGNGSETPLTAEIIENRDHFLKMNGREVFKEAIRRMSSVINDILLRNNISIEDIACVVPHQANMRIISAITDRIGISSEKMFVNLQKTGNTSAASIPIALDDAVCAGKIKKGDIVLLVAFGAGMTWGAALIRW